MENPEPDTTTPHECEDLGCLHITMSADDPNLANDPQGLESELLARMMESELISDSASLEEMERASWTDSFQSYSAAVAVDGLPSVFLVVRAFRQGDGYGREIFDASRDREEASRLIARHSILMPDNYWDIVEYVPTF
jgi:hypothetical protein